MEKKTIKYIRGKQRLKIKELDIILNLKNRLESISTDQTIYLRATVRKEIEEDRFNKIPGSHQNMFFLSLCQFFFNLQKYGLGQVEQVNLTYDLFVHLN